MKGTSRELTSSANRTMKSFFHLERDSASLPFFQPKLTVGPVNDAYEQEADAVAEKIVSGIGTQVQTKISSVSAQRKCAHCEEEESLQRKATNDNTQRNDAPAVVSDVINSPGQTIDNGTRRFMESRFGYDFGNVKIHTDAKAAESAQSINALAYTSGDNVVFNSGQYSPNSNQGRRLLAHELTHVIQQSSGDVQAKKIQRECLRTAPGSDETPYIFTRNGNRVAAEFSDAAGAESFIRSHSGQNLVCHRITRGRRHIFKIYQRRATTSGSGSASATTQDEIFTDAEVSRMKSFFIHNASDEDSLACINTVRSGVGSLVYGDSDLTDGTCPSPLTMTAHNTMEETMAQLSTHSMANNIGTIRFNDSSGQAITSGSGREPMQLASSVWTALVTATGTATGWSVFGLSLCDGFHSVTITVDHRNRDNIIMYWSDQTGNHPVQTSDRISGLSGDQFGWERMAQTGTSEIGSVSRGLDEYIRYAVRSFWGLHADEARGTTPLTQQQREGRTLGICAPVIRLWRISRP